MRDDTVVTGRDGDGSRQAGVAGWSVPGYTELKVLGSGGFGDVVLAWHEASGTLVAIKYLRGALLADPQWPGLFRAEAQVLAGLDDPHVVRLYEYVESPSGAAIVMELVDGVSLREILVRQGATWPEAALVVLQGSLLGLAAAHRAGVVHRDYKPENVLVGRDGDSKLTDFGIAARAGAAPVAAGSVTYAPPEQFGGAPASPAGDIYAATATFYECLTGRPPFTGDTAEALLYQHLTEPVPLEAVPGPLRPLVAAGMAKEPGDRPADAAAFVTALTAIAARAYGPDWTRRGRSYLGEAALALAALWPSGAPVPIQGSAVQQVSLPRAAQHARKAQPARESRHLRHLRHVRHLLHLEHLRGRRGLRLSPVKAAIAAGAAVAVVAAGAALAAGHGRAPAATLPAVAGVSPAGGSTMGGTIVTITGTGLAHASAVRFGGVPGRITADSNTRITVTSPPRTGTAGSIAGGPPRTGTAGGTVTAALITTDSGTRITGAGPPATGTVDITVTTPAGTSRPAAADHYTYTAPRPAVTGISPDGGSSAGGTTVSITGTGLAGATGVRFGAAAGVITADSNTQITVTSPPGTGTVTVTVTTPAGTSATAAGQFTYTAHPKQTQSIRFTAPASATAGGSAALSATGGHSGNPVVFSVDRVSGPGVCTVSRSTVTYTAAGTCIIDANQAGNAAYAAAAQVQQAVTVTANTGGGTNGSGQQPRQTQWISFPALGSGTVGGSAALSATASSGLPVSFSVDGASGAGVCTVSGRTVAYTAAGSCVIDASQPGNAAYQAAPQAQQTVTVTGGRQQPRHQSISFTPPGPGTVGGSAALSATATSGLPVAFTVDNPDAGVCTVSLSTVTYTAAGSCVIDANQAGNATYQAAPQVQGTITVSKISQTISFTPPGPGTVGDQATLSATATSGLTVSFTVDAGSGAGVCTVDGTTVTYTGHGPCVIDANQAGNATYAAAPQVQGTIPVFYPPAVITNISPTMGQCGGGDTVTITGTGLGGATSVTFGGTDAVITSDSSTQITVTSPPGPGYTAYVDVIVTTPGHSATSPVQFEYVCLT